MVVEGTSNIGGHERRKAFCSTLAILSQENVRRIIRFCTGGKGELDMLVHTYAIDVLAQAALQHNGLRNT